MNASDRVPETEVGAAVAMSSGGQWGPYRIDAPIGAGGMGRVFRAVDLRLDRPVAIKVSLTPFDPRFHREARAIAHLNHPNVCTLYDVGPNYLVMELCEGETLAARIERGRIALSDVLRIGSQIAAALSAAHAKGIVHRDLKPANVILTKLGVKVLDFGLAKAPSDSLLTVAHAVMGTPAYMAPEQREGREADQRTDIYALGLVLHEMATGRRLQPDEQPHVVEPPQLAHAMNLCLATDPDARWQSAADVRSELEWAARVHLHSSPARRAGFWAQRASLLGVAVGGAAVAASLAFAWFSNLDTTSPANPLADAQFARLTDFEGAETEAAISRDGRFVAFRSDRDGTVDTWLSQVGTGRFINMTRGSQPTVQVDQVGFSPDGSELWLSGIQGGVRLRLVPLSGGEPRAFLGERAMNVAWSPDGSRLVSQAYDPGDPFVVADATGANAKQIYVAGPGGHAHFPVWSADGAWIYFVGGTWFSREMDIWRIRPDGGEPEKLTSIASDIRYLAPIDAKTVLFCAPAPDGAGPWLWALDTESKQVRRISYGLERFTSVEASGDGRRLVATLSNPAANLWSVPLLERIASASDVKPVSLPSGRALAPRYVGTALFYLSSRGGGDGLWRLQGDQAVEIWRGVDGTLLEPGAPSPDSRRLAIILRQQGRRTLHTISADGGDLQAVTDAVDVSSEASWSPDGQWIAVSGEDADGPGLFRVPIAGGAVVRLSRGAATNPLWSPDGAIIAYTNPIAARVGHVQFMRSSDGTPIDSPTLQVRIGVGERFRFVPGKNQLVYIQDTFSTQQTLWLFDLDSKGTRQLADFDMPDTRTFDVTPDGTAVVFDRLRENADIVLIDLPPP